MTNLIGLIDAICDTYDRLDFRPKPDGTTFCNEAVHSIASTAFNYSGFRGLMADQIITLMGGSDWVEIQMGDAQDYANKGSLVVAGLSSTEMKQGHGHVVIIRPGISVDSGRFDGPVPRCVNIGASNFLARGQSGAMTNLPCGINEAFIPLPKFYVLRSSL